MVRATVSGATGAGVTSCQVRIRKGTDTTGAVVGGTTAGVFQEAQGASSFYSMNVAALDTSLGVAATPSGEATYTVTVQQVGASGNGTVILANLSVEPAAAPQQ